MDTTITGNIIILTFGAIGDPDIEILLGHKLPWNENDIIRQNRGKRKRVGIDKWVPPGGGKQSTDKDDLHAAQRETLEETGWNLPREAFRDVGTLKGYFGPTAQEPLWSCRLYFVEVTASMYQTYHYLRDEYDDMEWYARPEIPWDEMLGGDRVWIPTILDGKRLDVKIYFDENDNYVHCGVQQIPELRELRQIPDPQLNLALL